jgi:ankyrin repeat protein
MAALTQVFLPFLLRRRMTPIMYAARDGHPQVVALLVAHGAEVNAQDENGYTVSNIFIMLFFISKTLIFFIISNL